MESSILAILIENSPAITAAFAIIALIYKSNADLRRDVHKDMQAMSTALVAEMNRRDERINKRIDRVEARLESVSNDVTDLKQSMAKLVVVVELLKDWHPANPKNAPTADPQAASTPAETTAESPPPYNQPE